MEGIKPDYVEDNIIKSDWDSHWGETGWTPDGDQIKVSKK